MQAINQRLLQIAVDLEVLPLKSQRRADLEKQAIFLERQLYEGVSNEKVVKAESTETRPHRGGVHHYRVNPRHYRVDYPEPTESPKN